MQHVLDAFLSYLSIDGTTPASTLTAYRTDLTQCITFLAGQGISSVQALQPDHLHAFYVWLQEQGYATATIARRVVSLRAFSAFLLAAGILAFDLCANLSPPTVTRTLRSTVTLEQIGTLRAFMLRDAEIDGWRDRAMLEVLLATALRASDLVALDVDNIALEAATITIQRRDDSTRTFALPPVAIMALVAYLQLARPKLLRAQTSETALFVNQRGERLTRQGCWAILKDHARRLGLDGVTPEVLRQSVAVHRFTAGATVDEVQELLGHATRKTTAVYCSDELAAS